MNRHLTKEDIRMANKCIKRGSKAYDIRKLQINTKIGYYYLLEWLKSILLTPPNANKDV